MAKWARVVDGIVLETFEGAAEKPVLHAELAAQLVEVGDDVTFGHVRDGATGAYGARKPDVAKERAAAIAAIDGFAETVRLRFITPGTGQALVYEVKRSEADFFFAVEGDQPVEERDVPLMAREARRQKVEMAAVALQWRDQGALWLEVAGAIETERLGGKEAVRAVDGEDAAARIAAARDRAIRALDAIAPVEG